MTQPIVEALKELLRVVLLATIPVIVTSVESGAVDAKIIATVALLAGLRFVDKWLHEKGKEEGDKNLVKGLTRF